MRKYHYRVTENKLLTPTVRSVKLASEEGRMPLLYEPGQYASVSLHDRWRPTTTRCFSIASSPTDHSALEFCARVGGAYTHALERLQKGDEVMVRGPFGSFTLPQYAPHDLVFFAGGIGITPFMSMLRSATALKLSKKMHLVYSCRNETDIPFFEELVQLQRQNPNIRVTFVVTEGTTDRLRGQRVLTGRISREVLKALGMQYERRVNMVCGPSGYLDAVRGLLREYRVPEHQIVTEEFGQGTKNRRSTFTGWPANMYALSGLSLVAAGFFVTTSDLLKTLPTLEATYEQVPIDAATLTPSDELSGTPDIDSIPPQVDTNTTPAPVIKYATSNEPKSTAQTAPAQTTTVTPAPQTKTQTVSVTPPPAPVQKTQPAPTTVRTVKRPRTRTS